MSQSQSASQTSFFPFGDMTDGVIIKQIFTSFDKISWNSSYTEIVASIFGAICSIILSIIIKYFLSHSDVFTLFIKKYAGIVCYSLVYRKMEIDMKYLPSYYEDVDRSLEKSVLGIEYISTISKNENKISFNYIPFLHNHKINEYLSQVNTSALQKKSIRVLEVGSDESRIYFSLSHSSDTTFFSKNLKKIDKIFTQILFRGTKIKNNKPRIILVNGPPGLGKSTIRDHVINTFTTKSIWFEKVFSIDMTAHLDHDFKPLMNAFFHNVTIDVPSYFHFDEFDKYVAERLERSYVEYIKKCDKAKIPMIKDEYKMQERSAILYELLSMVERTKGIKSTCVITLCSNNFDTIFQGIDMKHFESLNDRFARVTFETCDRQEVVDYLSFYNNLLKPTEGDEDITFGDMYYPPEKFERAVSRMCKHVDIPFRQLSQICMTSFYDINEIVLEINRYTRVNTSVNTSSNTNSDTNSDTSDVVDSFTFCEDLDNTIGNDNERSVQVTHFKEQKHVKIIDDIVEIDSTEIHSDIDPDVQDIIAHIENFRHKLSEYKSQRKIITVNDLIQFINEVFEYFCQTDISKKKDDIKFTYLYRDFMSDMYDYFSWDFSDIIDTEFKKVYNTHIDKMRLVYEKKFSKMSL